MSGDVPHDVIGQISAENIGQKFSKYPKPFRCDFLSHLVGYLISAWVQLGTELNRNLIWFQIWVLENGAALQC